MKNCLDVFDQITLVQFDILIAVNEIYLGKKCGLSLISYIGVYLLKERL